MEVGNMLEEVQMPPSLAKGIIRLTALTAAFGTSKLTASGKINVDIKLLLFRVKVTTLHQPRRKQAKGHLKKIGVSHRSSLRSDANTRNQSLTQHHTKLLLPTYFSEEPKLFYKPKCVIKTQLTCRIY
jgi:hypothetical protein